MGRWAKRASWTLARPIYQQEVAISQSALGDGAPQERDCPYDRTEPRSRIASRHSMVEVAGCAPGAPTASALVSELAASSVPAG